MLKRSSLSTEQTVRLLRVLHPPDLCVLDHRVLKCKLKATKEKKRFPVASHLRQRRFSGAPRGQQDVASPAQQFTVDEKLVAYENCHLPPCLGTFGNVVG